ncbi:MAG TPA: response regulator [Terriglobia bacterium]|nr:response regulator [Terriglobia bacterium]
MSKPLRLLQIEDSESDADIILRLLMQSGFEVFSHRVEDGEGLRHALEDPTWDVIIADYHLPGFDAPGALRILQECGHDIPCIVVSGKMGEDTAVEMMKSGAHDYLTKNNLTRLAPAVERELAEAAARRESKQAQEELRGSEERLALAVDATQIGTFDFYPQTGKLIWSKFARQHFGLSTEMEVSYDTFLNALHPADRDRVTQTLQNALRYENGGDYVDEYRTLGVEDGQERWLSSRGRVFFDAQSQPFRFVGVILNITERKRLEQQLLQAQKLESIGRLAGSIAHDFNNLLTIINGYAHLVLAEMGPQDALRDSMEELSKAAMQAAGLTRQLVSFSRRQVAEPKTIAVNEFVKDYENMLRRLLGENIELVLSLDAQAGAFRADPGQIGQVLMNLAVNAKDAMPAGGKLVIETSCVVVDDHFARTHLYVSPGQYVVLEVTDTGTGMSAEVKSHLFEPFYTTKEHGKGTGLGLSTVYGIVVNQSSGSIWVSSEPGRGTTFKLFFPSFGFETTAGSVVSIERISSQGETILLAEDEAGVRKYTREILERYGYIIVEATNGMEALSVARSHPGPIHLLLTDIIMPTMGGMELAEKFAAEFPRIPVLFMSGYSDQIMRHWSALSAYIQKPFTLSDLLIQVRELLDRAAPSSLHVEDLPAAG